MQNKKIGGFLLVFFLIFTTACEEETFDIERFGSISGIVVDGDTYEPLQGVLITTTPSSNAVLTDEGGTFQLEKIKEGDAVITARKKDFLNGTVNIAVYEEENTAVTFFLLEDENNVGSVILSDPVPGNGAVNQDLNFTFSWNVDRENPDIPLTYSVFIFESNSTVQDLVGENLPTNEANVTGLKPNTTYFWYVVAKYEGRNVANSPTWTFATGEE